MTDKSPNRLLRALREARGTREEVAEALSRYMHSVLGINREPGANLLGMWERGEVRPGPEYRKALRGFFDASDEELGLSKKVEANEASQVLIVSDIGGERQFHQFMQFVGNVAFGPVVDKQLIQRLSGETYADLPSRVEHHHVETVERAAQLINHWDSSLLGSVSVPDALAQLAWATLLLDLPMSNDIAPELHAAVSYFANVVGFAAYDSGRHAEARRAYLLGVHAAKAGSNWDLWAFNLNSLARQVLYFRNSPAALALLDLAKEGNKSAHPQVSTLLQTTRARSFAVQGDSNACQQSLEAAASLSSKAKEDTPIWVSYCDQNYIAGVAGGCFHELGSINPQFVPIAVHHIELATQRRKPGSRSIAFDMANLASIHLVSNNLEAAEHSATSALEITQKTSSARLLERLKALATQMGSKPKTPSLRKTKQAILDTVERSKIMPEVA